MTKSLTNALLGVLVRQGRLDMSQPAPVAAWREAPNDPRRQITPDDLLRMRSGLDLGQSLSAGWSSPFNIANQIMFAQPDMAATAAARPLAHPPKTVWAYSDGNTAILGALIADIGGGGDAQATQAFARQELFDPLGMGSVVLETDATGSPVGAIQAYASARAWGWLGQLFLDDGRVGEQRILPTGWVDYSTRLTPESEGYQYAAGLWINADGRAGMPVDSYMARGARGQYVVIVPSARMVIVKLGDADTPLGDIDQMGRFVQAAVAAAAS